MDRKSKTIFQLDSPFTDIQWPETSPQNQDTILELLCSLLAPIGQYRASNSTPSKGKRSKKRKRKEDKSKGEEPDPSRPPPPEISSSVVIGLNCITRSLESLSQKSKALKSADCEKNDAGEAPQPATSGIENKTNDAGQVSQRPMSEARNGALNVTEDLLDNAGQSIYPQALGAKSERSAASQASQCLELGSKPEPLNGTESPLKGAAQNAQSPNSDNKSEKGGAGQNLQPLASEARSETTEDAKEPLVQDGHVHRHFCAIFVPRLSQPPILHAHLPQLVATASLANPELPVTRLVQLPQGCEARLSEALGLPRVSFIGILDGAPHSKSLVDLVRECVPVIEIPWLEEAKKSVYLPLKINAIESSVPVVTKKEEKSA